MSEFPLFSKGEMLSVFSLCVFRVWFGVSCLCFAVLLFLVSLLKKFSGANFCFWVVVLVLCFFGGFLPMFCFFGGSLSKVFGKSLLMSGLLFFWVRSLGFSVDVVFRVFFLRDKDQVVTGHPHTRLFACSFFLCPAAFLFRPFWPCVLLLGVFSGCHSGPRALLELTGLELATPLPRPLFWTQSGKGFPCFSCPCVFFLPLFFFIGYTFSRRPSR